MPKINYVYILLPVGYISQCRLWIFCYELISPYSVDKKSEVGYLN